jgi:hypothetical protein
MRENMLFPYAGRHHLLLNTPLHQPFCRLNGRQMSFDVWKLKEPAQKCRLVPPPDGHKISAAQNKNGFLLFFPRWPAGFHRQGTLCPLGVCGAKGGKRAAGAFCPTARQADNSPQLH